MPETSSVGEWEMHGLNGDARGRVSSMAGSVARPVVTGRPAPQCPTTKFRIREGESAQPLRSVYLNPSRWEWLGITRKHCIGVQVAEMLRRDRRFPTESGNMCSTIIAVRGTGNDIQFVTSTCRGRGLIEI